MKLLPGAGALLFACGAAAAADPAPPPDPFSAAGICAFADHLAAEGDVAPAAAEYSRCLFLTESADGRVHPELRDKRVQALVAAGQAEQAAREAQEWARRQGPAGAGLTPETALRLGRGLIRAERDSLALSVLAGVSGDSGSGAMRRELLEAAAFLRLGAPDSARARLAGAGRAGGPEAAPYVSLLGGLTEEYQRGLSGSRWIAGGLSALVPGLGKAYAGRKMDGLATFITIAFMAWQSADGYVHDGPESIKGAIFAAAGGGLYLGNIYGSVRAIEVENGRRRSAHAERVRFAAEFRLP